MTWDVRHLDDTNIVYIEDKGPSTYQDYVEQTRKALELGKKHDTNLVLGDYSKAKSKTSIFDIFHLPALYDKLEVDKTNKFAVIIPLSDDEKGVYTFYETICKNRGRNVKLFHDKNDALEWLTTK